MFDDNFKRDVDPVKQSQDIARLSSLETSARGITAFLSDHAGASYGHGLYRIHAIADMARWTELVVEAFPDFRGRAFCFGFDWLGRMFAIDYERQTNGQFLVLMLEPGTGQALEIPVTFMDFHNKEFVQYQNEALAVEFFKEWQNSGRKPPAFAKCIGYKKPLFLNGSDITENLEAIDMEVYWSITAQLLSKVSGLREGTHFGKTHISD